MPDATASTRPDVLRPTVREATIALLRDLGMTTVFGNPGSTELPLFRDFPDDFRYVLGLQESVVMAMADGFAQAGRRAALVNLHSSAGVGHALGNLFTAARNQSPVVVTAGQQARSILPFEPFLYAERAAEFPQPFVKWACEPARAEDVPRAILRATLVALEPPCGPTFVSIPVDDWDRPCDPVPVRRVHANRVPEPEAIAACAAALRSAASPAIVVGAGAARDGAWDTVIALAERHGAPVWVSPLSAQCSFPENHRLFAGFLPANRAAIVEALTPHDMVLALGGPINLYHTEGTGPHLPPGCEAWLIGDNPAHAMWAPEGTAIVANVSAALALLLASPAPSSPRTLPFPRPAPPLLPHGVMTDAWLLSRVAALRPEGSIVVEEAASSRGAMHDHLPILQPDSFYTTASGGLGYGLPAAIGTALARPGERVVAVLGDGAAMYAIQGLHAAAELGLPVSFVIIKNGRYEALHHFRRHFALQSLVGTDLGHLDFVALAQAQGVPAKSAADAASLDAALQWSFAASGPTLVEAVVA